MLTLSIAALLFQTVTAPALGAGARNPSYAHDGRLAVSVQGDLWIVSTHGEWTRVTSGPAWDREPAWTPDGSAIVFSSDRAGNFDLWRIRIGPSGATGDAERVTDSPLPEGQPAVASDARIIFVRGRLGAATLWIRQPDGSETRVTKDRVAEEWPVISFDGTRLAYVAISDGTHKLHVRALDSGRDSVVLTDARVEYPAWAPAGDRLSWTATGSRGFVYVTPLDGRYVNLVSARHAESAWSPDGKTIALTEISSDAIPQVGYNGDPDRTGDREANLLAASSGRLWTVDAPSSPDQQLAEQAGTPAVLDRAQRNADAFDQLWSRTAALYYSAPDAAPRRAQWEAMKATFRPRAVAAKSDDKLKTVMHDMLRMHPPYRQPASGRAAVSSAHPVATVAGVEMLAKGGNVVDAAVACRSRSASSSPTRADRAATDRCSFIRRTWTARN